MDASKESFTIIVLRVKDVIIRRRRQMGLFTTACALAIGFMLGSAMKKQPTFVVITDPYDPTLCRDFAVKGLGLSMDHSSIVCADVERMMNNEPLMVVGEFRPSVGTAWIEACAGLADSGVDIYKYKAYGFLLRHEVCDYISS